MSAGTPTNPQDQAKPIRVVAVDADTHAELKRQCRARGLKIQFAVGYAIRSLLQSWSEEPGTHLCRLN